MIDYFLLHCIYTMYLHLGLLLIHYNLLVYHLLLLYMLVILHYLFLLCLLSL